MARLTQKEISALLAAAGFLASGEWDEVISEQEYEALISATLKLQQRVKKAAAR